MTAIILISLVFLIGLGIGIFVFWLFFREKDKNKQAADAPRPSVSFRWGYVALPIALFVISILLAVVFYPRLFAEAAYRFNFDGSPRNFAGRQTIIFVTLIGQFILTLMACAIVWGATALSGSAGQTDSARSTQRLVMVMGNMVAVPQLVIGFVMADIFGYNVYARHLLPLWAFALAVMLLAGVVLVIFFVKTIRRSNKGK
jgi:uncharacterized membrane protein